MATGFDAPVLHTLYIDKPMRGHGLLQAITRVNRVFNDKPGGLIVDYIGIGEDLRASLRAYDDADLDDPVIPAAKAVARLWEKYEVICDLLHPVGYRQGELHLVTDEATLFLDAYNHVLETEERTQTFLDAQLALAKWYALARTQPASLELRDEVGLFNRLAAEARKIIAPDAQASKEAEQAVRQFMSEGLAAGDVVNVFGLAEKDRPEISVLSADFLDSIARKTGQENIQRKLIQKLLNDELKARSRTNNLQAKRFSDESDAVLRPYEQRQISSAEVVERLFEIAKRLRDSARRHDELGLTEEEAAFYGWSARPRHLERRRIAADRNELAPDVGFATDTCRVEEPSPSMRLPSIALKRPTSTRVHRTRHIADRVGDSRRLVLDSHATLTSDSMRCRSAHAWSNTFREGATSRASPSSYVQARIRACTQRRETWRRTRSRTRKVVSGRRRSRSAWPPRFRARTCRCC